MKNVILTNFCADDECEYHCYGDTGYCSEHLGLTFRADERDLNEQTALASVPGAARFCTEFEVTLLKKHMEKLTIAVPRMWLENIKPLAEALQLNVPNVYLRAAQADVLLRAVFSNAHLDDLSKHAFDCVICSCVLYKWAVAEGVWRTCVDQPLSKVALAEEVKRAVCRRHRLV